MLWLLFNLHVITGLLSSGLCDVMPPSQPQNVLADNWRLSWKPDPGDEDVNFTVYYHSLQSVTDEEQWKVVPACHQTPSRWCDVTFLTTQALHGCVKLQVQAERHGLVSRPGPACSVHGDFCTPEVRLSARPGSLTVHLTEDHGLFQEHAAHASHRIYFGQEGAPLQDHVTSSSSWTFEGLEDGRRYCARVEYLIFNKSVGLSSCVQCQLIPERASSGSLVTGVLVGFLLVLLVLFTSYIFIFYGGKLKRCLKPPYKISEDLLQPLPHSDLPPVLLPLEENISVVSLLRPDEETLNDH